MSKMVDRWNKMSESEMKTIIDRVISTSFILDKTPLESSKQNQLEMHFTVYKMIKKQIIKKYCT